MECPRCGTAIDGLPCPNCGFPVFRVRKAIENKTEKLKNYKFIRREEKLQWH